MGDDAERKGAEVQGAGLDYWGQAANALGVQLSRK